MKKFYFVGLCCVATLLSRAGEGPALYNSSVRATAASAEVVRYNGLHPIVELSSGEKIALSQYSSPPVGEKWKGVSIINGRLYGMKVQSAQNP